MAWRSDVSVRVGEKKRVLLSVNPATNSLFSWITDGIVLKSTPALKRGVERGRKRIFLWIGVFFFFFAEFLNSGSVITGYADIAKQISIAVVWHVAVVAAVCKSWSSL